MEDGKPMTIKDFPNGYLEVKEFSNNLAEMWRRH
jgi:hypothetical protein